MIKCNKDKCLGRSIESGNRPVIAV